MDASGATRRHIVPAGAWQARAPLLVVANTCALLPLAIGAFVLGAWLLREQVQAAGSVLWLMKANTALCVVATSAATLLLANPRRDGRDPHGGPCGQTVVHQDHRATGQLERRTIAPQASLHLRHDGEAVRGPPLQLGVVHPGDGEDILVHHDGAPAGHRTEGQLLVTREAELAHDQHVETAQHVVVVAGWI